MRKPAMNADSALRKSQLAAIALFTAPDAQHVTFTFPEPGKWHEWLFDYDEMATSEPFNGEIPGSFGKVWILQKPLPNA